MHWVLVAACGIFSYGMWGLAPWPGIELGPSALGPQSLSHWITGEIPKLNSGRLVSKVAVGSRPSWKRIFIRWKKTVTGRLGRGCVGTACAFLGPGTYSPGLWLWEVHPPLVLIPRPPRASWPMTSSATPVKLHPTLTCFSPLTTCPITVLSSAVSVLEELWSLGSTLQSGPLCGEREQSNCPDVCGLPSPKN